MPKFLVFLTSKLYTKHKFLNNIVNNIKLTQNLTYILRTKKKKCNLMIRFSNIKNLNA